MASTSCSAWLIVSDIDNRKQLAQTFYLFANEWIDLLVQVKRKVLVQPTTMPVRKILTQEWWHRTLFSRGLPVQSSSTKVFPRRLEVLLSPLACFTKWTVCCVGVPGSWSTSHAYHGSTFSSTWTVLWMDMCRARPHLVRVVPALLPPDILGCVHRIPDKNLWSPLPCKWSCISLTATCSYDFIPRNKKLVHGQLITQIIAMESRFLVQPDYAWPLKEDYWFQQFFFFAKKRVEKEIKK